METKNVVQVVLDEEEKITLNKAISILSNICEIYDTYCCKGCPLEDICKRHADTIANVLDYTLDKIEVK